MRTLFLALLWVTLTHASPTREAAPPDLGGEQALTAQSPVQYEESTLVENDAFEPVEYQDEMPFEWNSPLGSEDPTSWVRRDRRQVRWPNVNRVPQGHDSDSDSDDQDDAQKPKSNETPAAAGEFPPKKKKNKGKKTKGQNVKSSTGSVRRMLHERYNARQNQPEAGPSQPVAGPSGLQPPVDQPGTYVLQGPGPLNQHGRYGDSNVLGVESGSGIDCRQCQGSDCYSCDNPGPRCNVVVMDANHANDIPRLFEDEPRLWFHPDTELSNRIEFQQETFDPWTQIPEQMLASMLTCCEDCPVDDCICSGDSRCEQFLAQPFNNDRTTVNRYRAFLEHKRKRSHRYVYGFSKYNWSDTKKFRDGTWTPRNTSTTTTTTTPRPDGPGGSPPRRGYHGHRIELRSAPIEENKSQIGRLFAALGIKPHPFTQDYIASIREQVRDNPRWDNYEGEVEEHIFCLFQ